MTARRDFPVDARKPVSCVRYAHVGIAIRATADGVFIDGDPSALTGADLQRFEKLKKLANDRHRTLRAGRTPPASREPKWVDVTQARREDHASHG